MTKTAVKIFQLIKSHFPLSLILVLFAGLLVRLLIVGHPGFLGDIVWWKWWALVSSKEGLVKTIYETSYNYPPAYLYILKAVGSIYRIFAPLDIESVYWRVNDYSFLFLIKMPSVISDLVTGWGIWYLLDKFRAQNAKGKTNNTSEFDSGVVASAPPQNDDTSYFHVAQHHLPLTIYHKLLSNLPLLAAFLYVFNPVVIFDSAWWGQTDSVGTALTLISVILLLRGNSLASAAVTAATIFVKTQFIIFTPFIFLCIFLKEGYKKTIKSLGVAALAALIINLPFLLIQRLDSVVTLIFSTVDYFPNVSMNAFNLWWGLIGGKSMEFSDKHFISSLLTYKTAGLLLFAAAFSLCIVILSKKLLKDNDMHNNISIGQTIDHKLPFSTYLSYLPILSLVFAFAAFSFFMLNTQMHERYIFPYFAFALLWLFSIEKSPSRLLLVACCYFLVSIATFLNLHIVLIWNYPENGLPFLSSFRDIPATMTITTVHFIGFIMVLLSLVKLSPKLAAATLVPFVLILAFLALKPIPGKLYLSDIKPVYWSQPWGEPTKDRSVGNNFTKTGKSFLSSAYYFYEKGIGSHANSNLIYDLNGKFRTFETDMGVDTESNDPASVKFEIKADGVSLFESGVFKKWTAPGHAKVDITGKKYLELLITDAGDSNNSDHADWLNPILLK